jgi:hypothetical protein
MQFIDMTVSLNNKVKKQPCVYACMITGSLRMEGKKKKLLPFEDKLRNLAIFGASDICRRLVYIN